MKLSGVQKQKICFIFDESNALGPAFLERMNALLAAGEVPGRNSNLNHGERPLAERSS